MTHYKDKDMEFPAYRMFLIGRSLVFVIAGAIFTVVLCPDVNVYILNTVCLCLTLAALLEQIWIDRTLIRTGQFLVEDGEALYTVIGIMNLGFGRKHHRSTKHVASYRYSYIYGVKKISRYPFGIGLRARIYTAASSDLDVSDRTLENPGELKRLLMEKGKKKTVLFRIEHNLLPKEEERLLKYLESL